MFKSENKPNDFILAPGYYTPTQKVRKFFEPLTLWSGLKTQSVGVDPKGTGIKETQSADEYAHVLRSHLLGLSALPPYLNKNEA